ncbi:MAG: glycoside hydrolase family 27 protein, partial [Lachnospiraceae bacterium]|nr:glycoside hydrolase family 27 protein [Lachnospiraceae bacterium]
PDMYGLNPACEGAQAYYDSLFALYAEWGVDFIKCDDICRMDMPSARAEIAMLHRAMERCGREMVLSLSPGPAKIEEAWYYAQHANMWRITDDFWDHWDSLKDMFDRCELWQRHVSPGSFPDCDMLPLGKIGKAFGNERDTGFTRTEQVTMMNLWCIFRAPLMIGAELTKSDDWTTGLLTNETLLACIKNGGTPRQLCRDGESAVWMNEDGADGSIYLALFNIGERERRVSIGEKTLRDNGVSLEGKRMCHAWGGAYAAGEAVQTAEDGKTQTAERGSHGECMAESGISVVLPAHGSVFLALR